MKILLDTDIGSDIDDALALLLLLRSPGIELLGVTTVYGRVDIRAKIARKLLDAAGLDVPIIAGEAAPIHSPEEVWHAGIEGDGMLSREEWDAPLSDFRIGTGADDFLIEMIEKNRNEVTLVSLGTLTNLAYALDCNPKIAEYLKSVYFMGEE